MANYLRPGNRIGIIGGNASGLMLCVTAQMMGFTVYVLDPDDECPAHRVADRFFKESFNDISAIERFGRMCDVVTYVVEDMNVQALSDMSAHIYMPQTVDLLALTKDKLLLKGFLEDCYVNVLPYATIVKITDIEEHIDGIGYPCYLKSTRSDQFLRLEDAGDVVDAMPMVREGTCVLEASIQDGLSLSISVCKNEDGTLLVYPVVEHQYTFDRLSTTVVSGQLTEDLQHEVQRIATVIGDNLSFQGMITIELMVTKTGVVFVQNIKPTLTDKVFYTHYACHMDAFEAHIRAICNWPLPATMAMDRSVVLRHIEDKDFTLMQRQVSQQANWQFCFYGQHSMTGTAPIGHIAICTDHIGDTLQQLSDMLD